MALFDPDADNRTVFEKIRDAEMAEQLAELGLVFGHLGHGARVYDPNLSVFLRPEVIHIGANSRIDAHVKLEGGQCLYIGDGVHISSFVHVLGGGELFVRDNAAITSGACIITGSNTMDGQAMSSAAPAEMQVVVRGAVEIGECAIVAAHAVVLPNVRVGRYAVCGAGAVVTKDVPDYAIVFGCPARVVGDRRDREGWNYA